MINSLKKLIFLNSNKVYKIGGMLGQSNNNRDEVYVGSFYQSNSTATTEVDASTSGKAGYCEYSY